MKRLRITRSIIWHRVGRYPGFAFASKFYDERPGEAMRSVEQCARYAMREPVTPQPAVARMDLYFEIGTP